MDKKNGFSLVEVAVAMTVFSVVALGMSTMLTHQTNKVMYLEDSLSHQNLQIEIERLITNDNICIASLRNVRLPQGVSEVNTPNPNASQPVVIRDGDNVRFSTSGQNNTFEHLRITGISVQNLDLTNAATNNVGRIQVRIDVARNRGTNDPMRSIFVNQNVEVNPSNRAVTSCNGSSGWELGCLEQISGGGATSAQIPADAKVIRITKAPRSCNNSTDNDTYYPGFDMYIPIADNRASGTPITPGQVISIFQMIENRGGNPRRGGTYVSRVQRTITNVPTCHRQTDYVHDTSEGWCASGGGYGMSFWK